MDRLINENAVLSAIGEWIAHNEHTYTNATEYLRNRIKAIKNAEQEPCEDCISRQAVLEIAKSSKSNWIDNSVLFKRVNELPPVTPKPKTGHWVEYTKPDFTSGYKCSECGCIDDFKPNYCSECGAKMGKVRK